MAARSAAVEALGQLGCDPARPAHGHVAAGKGAGSSDAAAVFRNAVHGALGRAASALVAVQLDDVAGEVEAQNLPGTIDEHPNWRRRYDFDTAELGDLPEFDRVAGLMDGAGRGRGDTAEDVGEGS